MFDADVNYKLAAEPTDSHSLDIRVGYFSLDSAE